MLITTTSLRCDFCEHIVTFLEGEEGDTRKVAAVSLAARSGWRRVRHRKLGGLVDICSSCVNIILENAV